MFLFRATDQFSILISEFAVLFMGGVIKVMVLYQVINLSGEFTYLLAFVPEFLGPPLFHERERFGFWDMFLYNSVKGVSERIK